MGSRGDDGLVAGGGTPPGDDAGCRRGRVIYLRAGLFAEGPTDYYFLQGI
jgi:hypothetical protein